LKKIGWTTAGLAAMPSLELLATKKPWFEISLAEWSLHRTLFKGDLKNIDFPEFAAKKFDIRGVEYVNAFFKDKAKDMAYLKDLNGRAKDNGVRNVLIMVDSEGALGDADVGKRREAVENHYKWIDAAAFLGCGAVRVNAVGKGTPEEVAGRVAESLSTLADYGKTGKINVIVENHGGISSHGDWLAGLLRSVGKKNCGSLPDFGNFYEYDRYKGVEELMPFAKGVSAKTHDFDENGNDTKVDYDRMMAIVKKSGFRGHIGIEYEGPRLSEVDGIAATKKLLQRFQV